MTEGCKKDVSKVVYPELSYKIVGLIFDAYNSLGYGYQEKYYGRAIELAFKENGIKFIGQQFVPIKINGNTIGRYFLDFLVEDKIIIELKVGDYFDKTNMGQVLAYLKATDKKLAIIANFTRTGVKFRRILNIK